MFQKTKKSNFKTDEKEFDNKTDQDKSEIDLEIINGLRIKNYINESSLNMQSKETVNGMEFNKIA